MYPQSMQYSKAPLMFTAMGQPYEQRILSRISSDEVKFDEIQRSNEGGNGSLK